LNEPPRTDLGKAFREDLTAHSAELLTRLATLLRNAFVHGSNNDTWVPLTEAVRRVLLRLVHAERSVTVGVHRGQLQVNEHRVKPSFNEHSAYRFLAEELARRHIGAIVFSRVPEASELVSLSYTLAEVEDADAAGFETLQQKLAQRQVASITLAGTQQESRVLIAGRRDRRTRALMLFLKGLSSVREILDGLRAGRSVGFRRAKRFVQDAADLLVSDRGLALSLPSLKNVGGYLENHAVNVCLYSILLGEKLGFDRRRIGDLGLAALMRDLGKATLPQDLLDKPGDLSPEEWKQFRRFPHTAVPGLLRFRGFHEGTLRQVLVAFEHQFQGAADRTLTNREFNLFTRIAIIAGDFDAMTTPRPYRPTALTPHDAIKMLVRDRHRTGADPFLLKAFVHAMGVFPVGSLVLLDTRELAIVCEPPFDDASLLRPRVRLFTDADGDTLAGAPLTELTATDERGRHRRTIVGAIDAAAHGFNVPRVLLLGAHG
jgi:HD-GYP domain-containing protein (c-di-GMP phosphodiesterase class II)